MTDPANWALVALIGAGVLLVAALATARAKADADGVISLRARVRAAAFPGMVTLLAFAGAAQSLLIAPAIRHFVSGHVASAKQTLAARPVATNDDDTAADGDAPASGGLILTESEYAMAMRNGDPLHVGFAAHDLKLTSAPAFGQVDASFLPPFVVTPLRVLRAAAETQRQQEQAALDAAVADLVGNALGTTGHGDIGSNIADLSGTKSAGASTSGQSAQPSFGGSGGAVAAIPSVIQLSSQPAAAAIPEPSTWATMVIGFAACGMAMRRTGGRRRAPQLCR